MISAALGKKKIGIKFLIIEKAKILDNAFIDSQFNYAPLTWMFCRKNFILKLKKFTIRL